jgi:tetratricopeptide (TPR) repeat protein
MGTLYFQIFCRRALLAALVIHLGATAILAADIPKDIPNNPEIIEPTATATPKATAENPSEAQQALRAYLQLQEQLHQTLLTIEQSRKDSEAAARQNAEMIATRLNVLEQSLTIQRAREAEIARKSSTFALGVAASLGGIGLLVMALTGWFLMRTARQFADIATLASQHALGHNGPAGLLTDTQVSLRGTAAEGSGVKLLGAIERLEKRIYDMEHGALVAHPSTETGDHTVSSATSDDPKAGQVALLLGKGQSLLHLDQPEKALVCFDEVLEIDPRNTEAFVKKGAALEKLKRLEDAVVCYDRALAVDDSMTLAYLYKGGVYNQLERFGEALQCYEKALRTQQKVAV